MDITPLIPKGKKIINAYGNGGFTLGAERVAGSIILLPEKALPWVENDFAALLALPDTPEILLIGTGKKMQPLAPEVRLQFKSRGIPVDAMDTGAACRTYNVLLAEGRAVVAALVAI